MNAVANDPSRKYFKADSLLRSSSRKKPACDEAAEETRKAGGEVVSVP